MSTNVLLLPPHEQLDEDLLDGSSSTMTLPPGHDVSEINHLTTPEKRPPTSTASRTPTDSESTPTDVEQLAKRIMHQHTTEARSMAAFATVERYAAEQQCDMDSLAVQLAPLGVDLGALTRLVQDTRKGLAECSSDDGWTVACEGGEGELRLLYQHQQGTHFHSFKALAGLDAPVEQPLCLGREFDLISSWNRYLVDTTILKENGGAELWVYCAVWLPWPFACRDMVIHAVGMDLLQEEGCIAVSFQAADDDLPEGVQLPAAAATRERIKVLPGSVMKLMPVPCTTPSPTGHTHSTQGVCISHIDANVPNVPNALIQFVLRVFSPFMYYTALKIIKKKFRDPQGDLPTRIRQRPELYHLISSQVAAYLAASPAPSAAAPC